MTDAPVSFGLTQPVHYVARGSADGVYPPVCRAAIVTEVFEGETLPLAQDGVEFSSDDEVAAIVVLNPTGLFFHERCVRDETSWRPGTFHTKLH